MKYDHMTPSNNTLCSVVVRVSLQLSEMSRIVSLLCLSSVRLSACTKYQVHNASNMSHCSSWGVSHIKCSRVYFAVSVLGDMQRVSQYDILLRGNQGCHITIYFYFTSLAIKNFSTAKQKDDGGEWNKMLMCFQSSKYIFILVTARPRARSIANSHLYIHFRSP